MIEGKPHQFVCRDCNTDVVSWGSDPLRETCYNCQFIRRVCDTPEQKAEMRKMLGCEWQERNEEKA